MHANFLETRSQWLVLCEVICSGSIYALMMFDAAEAHKCQDMMTPKSHVVLMFWNLCHNDLILWEVTWNGRMHTLMDFNAFKAYDQEKVKLT